jgi:hypothetical protein
LAARVQRLSFTPVKRCLNGLNIFACHNLAIARAERRHFDRS